MIVLPTGASVIGHLRLDVGCNGLTQDDLAVVSLDGRIDNRVELIASLGANREIRDDALILAAYHRWGNACAAHLLGDFAFVIWDKTARQMLCARDQIGIRPFCYHDGPTRFIFASEARAIVAQQPKLADEIDETWIADYVAGYIPDASVSLHRGIRRLPPGHICVATAHGTRIERYYTLPQTVPLARDNADEDFSKIFESAVACRMEETGRTAALLSGGLDSSSIATVAAHLLQRDRSGPLSTFSMVFPDTPGDDERPYIDAVVELGGISPEFLDLGGVAPFDHFDMLLTQQGGPFIGQNLAATARLHRAAADQGFRVLLDGHGGDEVVSHGALWLSDLAFSGQWLRLWREVRALSAVEAFPPLRIFFSLIATRGPQRRLTSPLVERIREWRGPPRAPLRHLYVDPTLAVRAGLDERRATKSVSPSDFGNEERNAHHADMASGVHPYALELLDRAAASAGIELRFPLLDRRVIEFCLSLPSSEKLRDGYTRSIIRRGLKHRLPDAVRKRVGKLDFTPHIVRGMLGPDRSLIEDILTDEDGTLGKYANLCVLRKAWSEIKEGQVTRSYGFDVQAIWRAVTLGLWLRQQKTGNGEI